MEFIFKTTATMKPHNSKNWWIDSGIVREIRVEADSLKEAIAKYRETVNAFLSMFGIDGGGKAWWINLETVTV